MPLPAVAVLILKRIAVTLVIILAIIAIGYGVKLYNQFQGIKSKMVVRSSYPTEGSKDGRYLYKINLNPGADSLTTKMLKVEALLDGNEVYYKTSNIHAEPLSGTWTTKDKTKIKQAKGAGTKILVFAYDMDGANIATSYTRVTLRVEVTFKFETFFKDFNPELNFDIEVPGPYDEVKVSYAEGLDWNYSGQVVTEEDLKDWDISLNEE